MEAGYITLYALAPFQFFLLQQKIDLKTYRHNAPFCQVFHTSVRPVRTDAYVNKPSPVRYTTIAYITCLLIYNIVGTYTDSQQFLGLSYQPMYKRPFIGAL